MKGAPLFRELKKTRGIKPILVHTGQHYDYKMSKSFFKALDLPDPDYNLDARSGTHSEQTAKIMLKIEKVFQKERPDMVVLFGDGNTTLAAALAAKKMHFLTAHVEAGLRSFDEEMPEEINRRLTDNISDLLFTPSVDGNKNLKKEGVNSNKILMVGNIMIDSLMEGLKTVTKKEKKILNDYKLTKKSYGLLTLHRPSNVDDKGKLKKIVNGLELVSKRLPLVLPLHPRTKKNLEMYRIKIKGNITITKPLGYIEFVTLMKNARFVLTDSGGIQEETTYLNVPCLTLRDNTERPVTITHGTNKLTNPGNMLKDVDRVLKRKQTVRKNIPLWDGKTAKRISKVFANKLV